MIFCSERLIGLVKRKIRWIFGRSNKAGETILTKSCRRFRLTIIKFLVWLGCSVDTINKKGETPLWATLNSRNKHKNNKLINFFVKRKVNLNKGYGGNTPLTFAIKKNDMQLVKILLQDKINKADINLKNAFGEVPLMLACCSDNLDLVNLLINNGANVNCKNTKGETPLWWALKHDKNDLAKLLINSFADINFRYRENSILELACQTNNYELAKLIFSRDVKINRHNNPLWIILNSRHMNVNCKNELVNLSLQYDTDINKEIWGETPLTFAVKENNIDLVKILISNKTNTLDINKKNLYDESALWIAINNGYKEIIKILIANGADVDCINLSNNTPIIYAIKQNDTELLHTLIKNKADVNKSNDKSPLWWAVMQNKEDIVKILVENDADVNKEYAGETPLMFAARHGNMELVKFLLKNEFNRADVNHANIFKETALWKAFNKKRYDILKFLIEQNANLDIQDFNGNTPLLVACRDGNIELVKLFLENNANLNIENENEETAVLIACIKGYNDIAMLLIKNNADINKKDILGRSVLSVACKTNNENLLKILVHKTNEMGKIPLLVACEKSDFKLIELFIKNGAEININIGGKTPLSIILRYIKQNIYTSNSFILKYYRKIAKYLIDNGANVNEIYGNTTPLVDIIPYDTELSKYIIDHGADINMIVYDKTPLLEAIIYNTEIAKYLISKGADVNKNIYNKFPLIEAIVYDKEMAKYLIDNGADVNITNLKGETPLGILINKYTEKSVFVDEQKDLELAKLLLANGADTDVLYNNLDQKERRKFIKLLLEDEVVKAIIIIRNKNANKEKLLDKETINLLDKNNLGIIRKTNIEMANVIFRKKKLAGNELKI